MDIRATPSPHEIHCPVSLCWIITLSSVSEKIIVDLADFAKLQVTTPNPLVPSHNNSSRGSNLLSTLYMWSSSLYVLISLQYLAKCPYLSHNQHSVSVFSTAFYCTTPAFISHTDCSTYRAVELAINRYIYIYIYVRTLISHIIPVAVYTTVNDPIQQHTAVHYNSWLP